MVRDDVRPSEVLTSELLRSSRGRAVRPKTAGQKAYADAIAANIVTFGIGPAGTGKSYLAVALAVQALQAHQVSRIILTRPAVEAGERLGFLPGDMLAKVDPYLRPLYDALHDLLDAEGAQRLIDKGAIEVAPLAFMRGRTLNNSLHHPGRGPEHQSRADEDVPHPDRLRLEGRRHGDMTQVDVAGGRSGLVGLESVLGGMPDLAFVHLRAQDVVRHQIVADIVSAYERATPSTTARRPGGGRRDARHLRGGRAVRPSRGRRPLVSAGPGGARGRGDHGRHRGVPALRRRADHRRPERTVPRASRARPTCWPSRSRTRRTAAAARPTRGAPGPPPSRPRPNATCCWATWSSARAVAAATPSSTGSRSTTRSPCSWCTGSCTCSGMDHGADEEADRMERREQQLLDRYYRAPALLGTRGPPR